MMQWRYDENRADFRPALPGEIEADPDALYIIQRGDVLMVREEGQERPMPERLEVAGVTFEWLATGRGKMQLSEDAMLDSVSAADAILVEDMLELRLVQAFRDASPRTRIALVEILEELTTKRLGRSRPKRPSLTGD